MSAVIEIIPEEYQPGEVFFDIGGFEPVRYRFCGIAVAVEHGIQLHGLQLLAQRGDDRLPVETVESETEFVVRELCLGLAAVPCSLRRHYHTDEIGLHDIALIAHVAYAEIEDIAVADDECVIGLGTHQDVRRGGEGDPYLAPVRIIRYGIVPELEVYGTGLRDHLAICRFLVGGEHILALCRTYELGIVVYTEDAAVRIELGGLSRDGVGVDVCQTGIGYGHRLACVESEHSGYVQIRDVWRNVVIPELQTGRGIGSLGME